MYFFNDICEQTIILINCSIKSTVIQSINFIVSKDYKMNRLQMKVQLKKEKQCECKNSFVYFLSMLFSHALHQIYFNLTRQTLFEFLSLAVRCGVIRFYKIR